MAFSTIRLKKKDKHIMRVTQNVIPRIGETIWLHSNVDPTDKDRFSMGSEMNTHKLLKKYGTTSFKVVEVCHWITESPNNSDSVMIYVKKMKM